MSKRQQTKAGINKTKQTASEAAGKTGWKVLITTASKVNVWNGVNDRFDTLFTSGSEGIVTAKLAKEGNVLAVAGSHVVLLHKLEHGQQQSYRLKGADATRLLEYAADGKSIFLNSTLKSSIQTYNVKDDKITETFKPHPSPVTSLASSLDSTLLISASANPPTIHLENLSLRTSTQLRPKASDHKVILSSFHPTRKNVFLLSFSDGVLAAYDYSKASKSGQHIHAFGHLHDAMMGGNGITAAEFIPGAQTRAVTAGEDGRCIVVDFDKKDVVGSFHVGAPVTCLSVRSEDNAKKGSSKWLVAVGTLHGWCYIYDHTGTKVHEVQLDHEGNRILEVRWKFGDIKLPTTPSLPKSSPRKTSSDISVPIGRVEHVSDAVHEGPIVAAEKPEAPIQFSAINKPQSPVLSRSTVKNMNKPLPKEPEHLPEVLPEPELEPEQAAQENAEETFVDAKPAWEDLQHGFTADYMSIFSPVKNAEPLRNSPKRRSTRLSIRSTNSPLKGEDDKITKLIQQDEDGLLRPSVSSPSLATRKSKSPSKKKVPALKALPNVEEQKTTTEPTKIRMSKRLPVEADQKQHTPIVAVPQTIQQNTAVDPETKPEVPLKDNPPLKPATKQPPPPSLPSTDSKAVDDFRKVREKIESSHGHPVLSLFSSHLPNQRARNQHNAENFDDKENSSVPTLSKEDIKAEKKRVKMEEKERKKYAREEMKRKKKEGSFPPVSDLVFKDDDMDIDGEMQSQQLQRNVSPQNLDLPSIASKISTKRKATNDPYEAGSAPAPKPMLKAVKGKDKVRSPEEEIAEDIWMPEEVRKPSKRINFGEQSATTRAGSQPPLNTGMMSIHDMIADLKATFKAELAIVKTDMEDKFHKQSELLEGLIKNERTESKALRDENERLKAQVQELISLTAGK